MTVECWNLALHRPRYAAIPVMFHWGFHLFGHKLIPRPEWIRVVQFIWHPLLSTSYRFCPSARPCHCRSVCGIRSVVGKGDWLLVSFIPNPKTAILCLWSIKVQHGCGASHGCQATCGAVRREARLAASRRHHAGARVGHVSSWRPVSDGVTWTSRPFQTRHTAA